VVTPFLCFATEAVSSSSNILDVNVALFMQIAQQFREGIEGLQYVFGLLGLGVGFVCNFGIEIGL
jgi:hypothetical protein